MINTYQKRWAPWPFTDLICCDVAWTLKPDGTEMVLKSRRCEGFGGDDRKTLYRLP